MRLPLIRTQSSDWNVVNDISDRLRQSQLKYADMSDREIVSRAQRGENAAAEYMLYKYRNLVRTKVKSYFLVGAEKEDLLQVGQIGLWQAIIDFRSDKAISFPAFAKVCITRHIITAIKTATRQKQMPLNQSLSLESPSEDPTTDWNLSDILPNLDGADPKTWCFATKTPKFCMKPCSRFFPTLNGMFCPAISSANPTAKSLPNCAAKPKASTTRWPASSAKSAASPSATPT